MQASQALPHQFRITMSLWSCFMHRSSETGRNKQTAATKLESHICLKKKKSQFCGAKHFSKALNKVNSTVWMIRWRGNRNRVRILFSSFHLLHKQRLHNSRSPGMKRRTLDSSCWQGSSSARPIKKTHIIILTTYTLNKVKKHTNTLRQKEKMNATAFICYEYNTCQLQYVHDHGH